MYVCIYSYIGSRRRARDVTRPFPAARPHRHFPYCLFQSSFIVKLLAAPVLYVHKQTWFRWQVRTNCYAQTAQIRKIRKKMVRERKCTRGVAARRDASLAGLAYFVEL